MGLRREVRERVERMELGFNRYGVDRFGVSKKHLVRFFDMLGFFYRTYFRARVHGMHNVPTRGRCMLVGNHSGGIAIDGGMVIASCFFELEPPRLAEGMMDRFINRLPFAAQWANKVGQLTGLPEHAVRLLEDDRLLMVFPEGTRGTAKLYPERYSLVQFGTGFVRLALETNTPIVPFAFIGGGEALPTVTNLEKLGKLLGTPYIPLTPYLLPAPLPVGVALRYGEPIRFEGSGTEEDAHIAEMVEVVRQAIAELIREGREDLGY